MPSVSRAWTRAAGWARPAPPIPTPTSRSPGRAAGAPPPVTRTRAAPAEQLPPHGRRWLDEMLGHGVTTIEAKSGYGLDVETELRLLEGLGVLGDEGPGGGGATPLGGGGSGPPSSAPSPQTTWRRPRGRGWRRWFARPGRRIRWWPRSCPRPASTS